MAADGPPQAERGVQEIQDAVERLARGAAVTAQTFRWRLRWAKCRAVRRREGQYLLRTNLTGEEPEVLW